MARLRNPATGTVVHCEGDLSVHYRTVGWVDADAPAQKVEAPSEKPAPRRRGRPPKTD